MSDRARPHPPAPTRAQLLTGRPALPARPIELRAGPVTALLDGADLRHVHIGPVELVERVYVAVRDAVWNTIPGTFDSWVHAHDDDRFEVTFRARHAYEDIRFTWRGTISGSPDGTIRYELDGRCEDVFRYAKIGFNVHHALEGTVGHRYRAATEAGELRGTLPEAIDPQRIVDGTITGMFVPYSELAIEVADGIEAVVGLEGDLLELQDHRNWADTNFKSYAGPLANGYDFTSEPGQVIRQVLTIRPSGPLPAPAPPLDPIVRIGADAVGRLPAVGLGSASHGRPLTDREVELIRAARPAHIRIDLRLADGDHLDELARASTDAAALGCPLELAVHVGSDADAELGALAARLRELGAPVARVLVYAAAEGFSAGAMATPADRVRSARAALGETVGDVVFAGGTDNAFVDVNRDPPTDPAVSGIMFMVSPTVHAHDDGAIVENVAGVGEVVRMARALPGERAVVVSPITLATRYGPYPGGPAVEGDLPPPVDVRQLSLLGAAWTVGALAGLATSGADAATFYETSGWRGVVETSDGSPMPDRFPSIPGQVFPLFHVFADLAEWPAGSDVFDCATNDRFRVAGLGVRGRDSTLVLVANLTSEAQRVHVEGVAKGSTVRVLDDAAAEEAIRDPATFRARPMAPLAVAGGGAWLALAPYAVARIDIPG